MVQVIDGRQKQWVSFDFTGVPNPIAKEGAEPNEIIVLSQLTRVQQEEAAARQAAIAAVNTALNTERQDRIAGDTLAEQRLQQAIEGVSKRTVADRYEGTTAPTPEQVPGVNTAAPATDWHSWFLWDQGAANPDTGIYYFSGTTPTRVPTVQMSAGLLVYNDRANTFWLMIDDPAGGTADFIPFGRSSDLGSTPPIYTAGNTIRLAFENAWLATQVNATTGETELTIAQSFRDRVANLEVDVDDLQSRLAANEQLDQAQNTRLGAIEAVNTSQDGAIASLTNRLTTNEQLDETQNTRLGAVEAVNATQDANITALTSRVATNEQLDQAQNTRLGAIEAVNTTQDTAIASLTNRITANEQLDAAQNARLNQVEVVNTTQDTAIASLTNRLTTNEQLDATQNARLDGLDATTAQLRTDVNTATATNNAQSTALTDLQATRQTAQQVLDAIALQFKANNPIKTLTNGVVAQVTRAGATYTQTTFTVDLGQADFARTRFSENIAPFSAIEPPDETYPGTSYVVSFLGMPGTETTVMAANGSVKDGVVDVWFHKGFR